MSKFLSILKIHYTSTHVEIFYNYVSLTVHLRDRRAYGYTTNIEHLARTSFVSSTTISAMETTG